MASGVELSAEQARRIALRAQRFGRARPARGVTARHVRDLLSALGALQIDAVNVLIRSHYLPLYSRLGPYRTDLLDRLVYRDRRAFEYLGHAASILPVELHPLLRWRMARRETGPQWRPLRERLDAERPGYLDRLEREVAERGPLTTGELSEPARRQRVTTKYAESTLLWYRWSDGKSALEYLFESGRLAAADRRGFERRYDLTGRVIPADVLAAPTPTEQDAQRELVLRAAAALGVATIRDLADYFRMTIAQTRARVRELVASGALRPASVDGWAEPAYLHPDAIDRPLQARALLSPFDSLIWERERCVRLFGFRPSFELYVRPEARRYGYYVLPFLLGEGLVARVDLKADHATGRLLVPGAFVEPGAAPGPVAGELAEELRDLAAWLGLETIEVAPRGDLAADLAKRLRRVPRARSRPTVRTALRGTGSPTASAPGPATPR
jgi:uncharacterized protein